MSSVTAPRLYAIADRGALGNRPLPDAVVALAAGGVRWIQIRAKTIPDRELFARVEECCRRLEGTGVSLWIDDRVDLAALLPVYGVHLGQEDLPPGDARKIVGPEVRIGRSTHDLRQVLEAEEDPDVDVVAVGPVFETRSKERPDPVVGLEGVREARAHTRKPLVAIGGLGASNLGEVLAAGADSAAMIGAFCRGEIVENCSRLRRAAGEGV